MADLQIPPIRTPLTNGKDAPAPGADVRTAKEWYYYWRHLRDAIGALARGLRYGTHTDRLNTTDASNGALWVETDRGNTIYEAQDDGAGGQRWVYVTGTMYGTLSPDQRPTDLRPFDAGFVYRTTDADTAKAPREFIWSGAEWVETTRVLYGTHGGRPVADEKTPARTIYVETDRGNTIYQQQANAWVYAAGTMYGTLSPDQRPAGLGANDAGFKFGATDTKRAYRWTGSAWAETTPQTPWTSDIDAAGFRLLNTGNVGIGTATVPVSTFNATRSFLTIRGPTANGVLELTSAQADALNNVIGLLMFSDGNNSQTEKRVAQITATLTTTTANNRGADLIFYTRADNATAISERIRITSAGLVGVGTSSPGYRLDVAGDVNISAGSSYRINGSPISGGGISTQNIVTGSRSLGSNFQNTTGKPMMATVTANANAGNGIAAYTDASSSPTTVVAQQTNPSTTSAITICLSFWVLPGNWYKVTIGAGSLNTWVEWY